MGLLLRASSLALLIFLSSTRPTALLSHSSNGEHYPATCPRKHQAVNVIIAGATGDLAAKYLWVALFRLAFEASSTIGQTFHFFAGASDTLERGRAWQEAFFDSVFSQRVCGAVANQELLRQCREFLETEFIPNIKYTPLREESHYRELGKRLNRMNEQLPPDSSEEGRIVYLAIPPQFFMQSCKWINQHLRRRLKSRVIPFLRVVVEKPFGRDLTSAYELATQLRAIYSSDGLYVMDHYAGKPVIHALRSYFQLNAAALHPIWNSDHIENIHIEMTETSTLENRIHYFDSTGIIRDVMVNHLQFLLNIVVTPSLDTAIFSLVTSSAEFTRRLHDAQLRFVQALTLQNEETSLFLAQYDEYATHYQADIGDNMNTSDHFTPTAAIVELTSLSAEWENTTFRIAAAKATDKRLLSVTVTFRDGVFAKNGAQPCTFIVTIQQAPNADTRQSQRIEWSCDVSEVLGDLKVPEGWEYLRTGDNRSITPIQAKQNMMTDTVAWKLGDEPSAYDILLREVASGAVENFANLDEVEAAWALWTPIIQTAETSDVQYSIHASTKLKPLQYTTYPTGTSPWKQFSANSPSTDSSKMAKEEL